MIFNYLFGCPSTAQMLFLLQSCPHSALDLPHIYLSIASHSLYISSIYILRLIRKSSSFNDPFTFLIIQSNLSIYLPISTNSLYLFTDSLIAFFHTLPVIPQATVIKVAMFLRLWQLKLKFVLNLIYFLDTPSFACSPATWHMPHGTALCIRVSATRWGIVCLANV